MLKHDVNNFVEFFLNKYTNIVMDDQNMDETHVGLW